jgi:hypothetical protein
VTWTAFVVSLSNTARTQNGHIRNDTCVVSRRISSVLTSPICRAMVRRGRRFESVRGLCKRPGNRAFFSLIDLQAFHRAVRMEPFMSLQTRNLRRKGPFCAPTPSERRGGSGLAKMHETRCHPLRDFAVAGLAGRPLSPAERSFVDTLTSCSAKQADYAAACVGAAPKRRTRAT